MTMIEIKHRWNGSVLYSGEHPDLKSAVEHCAAHKIPLDRASLVGASLRGASLHRASLVGASLVGASLDRASLRGASLDRASLRGASLRGASLDRAIFSEPFTDGERDRAKADFLSILANTPHEIAGLRQALAEGHIDGSVYEGECACLVGTLAKLRGTDHRGIPGVLPDSTRPAEQWFLAIRPGHLPAFNKHAAEALAWCDEALVTMPTEAA